MPNSTTNHAITYTNSLLVDCIDDLSKISLLNP